jgi:hypothetical protein
MVDVTLGAPGYLLGRLSCDSVRVISWGGWGMRWRLRPVPMVHTFGRAMEWAQWVECGSGRPCS